MSGRRLSGHLAIVVFAMTIGGGARAQGGSGAEAAAAYRQIIDRALVDEDAYLEGFAPSLECFYGEVGVPRARLRSRTSIEVTIAELHVVDAEADVVTLVDRGWYGNEMGELDFHEKVVRLRRASGRWTIVGENGARGHGCLRDALARAPAASQRFVRCRRAIQPALRAMRRRCDEPDDVHGCAWMSESAEDELYACFFGRTIDFSTVPPRIRDVRDVPWSSLSYVYRSFGDESAGRFQSVTFGDVNGDRRDEAIVVSSVERASHVQAYAVRAGLLIELAPVWDSARAGHLDEVRGVRVERGTVILDALGCTAECAAPAELSIRRRLHDGAFVDLDAPR